MDPKGAEAVLDVFKIGSPDVAGANIDITQTYTNEFAEKADAAVK
jgi:NitT/TauT family transport system substrate-binding protein